MTQHLKEDVRRMQKLSGILLEDDAFNSGRPNNGNHDDAHWGARQGSGQYSDGMAGDMLQDYDPSQGILMYVDDTQKHAVLVDGITSEEQFDQAMRKLVGDRVFSEYMNEPGVFHAVEASAVGSNVYVEHMTVREVARLLNRWAARNGMGQHLQRLDKSDMRAGA